jgi:hypothetical protein
MIPPSKPRLPDTIQAAIEDTVGLKGDGEKKWTMLAERLGISEGTLRHKVAAEREDKDDKADEKRHHLSLAEALEMARATGNDALVQAICKEFNGEFLPRPGVSSFSDDELLSRYTSMMRELGQFSQDIHKSLADGKITTREIGTLRKDFLRLSGALSEVMDRLQEQAARDKEKARPKLPPKT